MLGRDIAPKINMLTGIYMVKIRLITPAKPKSREAFTILEIMIAVVIFFIAIIGTSGYRYGAALNIHRADLHATAVRTAVLLSEGWNGTCGNITFNPVNKFGSKLDISESNGPDASSGFTTLGSYKIMLEGVDYYATLSWQNRETDLRALSVVVNWDPAGRGTGELGNAAKSYRLTTYVENPI
jgi:hypothetical protein